MRYVDKRFLNDDPYETSSICCILEVEAEFDENGDISFIDEQMKVVVKDCYKTVEIGLSSISGEDAQSRLEKLDNMIDALTKVREKLPIFQEEYSRLDSLRREQKKKRKGEEDVF